jgi:hypothetical protein
VVELPADLGFSGFRPVRVRKAGGCDGIRGGTECVRAHMADGDCLPGGSGRGRGGGSRYLTHTDATGEPTTDLLGGASLSPGERPSPGDERPRAVIIWSLSLKEPEDPFDAVGGPCGDKTSVGFAERLRRSHHNQCLTDCRRKGF